MKTNDRYPYVRLPTKAKTFDRCTIITQIKINAWNVQGPVGDEIVISNNIRILKRQQNSNALRFIENSIQLYKILYKNVLLWIPVTAFINSIIMFVQLANVTFDDRVSYTDEYGNM